MATQAATDALISGGSPTIFISDMDRAVRFYSEMLGLGVLQRAGDHFAMIDAGGGFVLGLHPATPNAPAPGTPGAVQVGLGVTRPIDEVVRVLKDRGVPFIDTGEGSVRDDGQVKLAYFKDPDGNILYLVESR